MKEMVIEKVQALIDASTCKDELRLAAGNYLDAIGTAAEKELAEAFLASLDANVNTIDESLTFFKSDAGRAVLGDAVDGFIAQFEEGKANGETYCMCPACQAGKAVNEIRDQIL